MTLRQVCPSLLSVHVCNLHSFGENDCFLQAFLYKTSSLVRKVQLLALFFDYFGGLYCRLESENGRLSTELSSKQNECESMCLSLIKSRFKFPTPHAWVSFCPFEACGRPKRACRTSWRAFVSRTEPWMRPSITLEDSWTRLSKSFSKRIPRYALYNRSRMCTSWITFING